MSEFIIDIVEVMLKHLEEGSKVNIKEIEDMIELIDELPENIEIIEKFEHRIHVFRANQNAKTREELERAFIIDIDEPISMKELQKIKYENSSWWDYILSWIWWK